MEVGVRGPVRAGMIMMDREKWKVKDVLRAPETHLLRKPPFLPPLP